MKILLSGGGTLGSVTPLLAIHDVYKQYNPDAKFVWVGTEAGPEKTVVTSYHIPFFTIASAKWRRYFSLWNGLDIFKFPIAFFQSLVLLWHEKPSLLISAGGFVSVPLHWAAFVLGIPTWIHQQDVRVGLANRLMAGVAKKITTALDESTDKFSDKKTEHLGNPVRGLQSPSAKAARKNLDLSSSGPVILAMGGGTGSARINNLLIEALQNWPVEWNVIHLTGRGKWLERDERLPDSFANYHAYPQLTEKMADAYAAADLVISRGGFGSITELASLGKATVFLPMIGTHQEENVRFLVEKEAAMILDERTMDGVKLAQIVKDLIAKPEIRQHLGHNLKAALPTANEERIIEIIERVGR